MTAIAWLVDACNGKGGVSDIVAKTAKAFQREGRSANNKVTQTSRKAAHYMLLRELQRLYAAYLAQANQALIAGQPLIQLNKWLEKQTLTPPDDINEYIEDAYHAGTVPAKTNHVLALYREALAASDFDHHQIFYVDGDYVIVPLSV